MAPISLEQVSENLSLSTQLSQEVQGLDLEECAVRGTAAAAGAFCMGFSGGVAMQVHYARFIPRLARSVLVLPVGVAVGASAIVYQHALTQCGKRWNAALTVATQTHSG